MLGGILSNLVVVTSVGLLVCGSDMRGSPAGGSHGWLLVRPPDNSFLTGSFPALSAHWVIPTKKNTNIETEACANPQAHPPHYITLTNPYSEQTEELYLECDLESPKTTNGRYCLTQYPEERSWKQESPKFLIS